MHSIRLKITAITIAAILTSVLAAVGACFFTIGQENDRIAAVRMNLLNQNVQKSLDEYFTNIEQSVEMASNLATESLDRILLVSGGVLASGGREVVRTEEMTRTLDAYLSDYCKRIEDTFGSVATHTHGVVTYYYCLNPEVSENVHGFFYSKVGKTGFFEQDPPVVETFELAEMDPEVWYYTAVQRGRPTWEGPYRSAVLNNSWTMSYLTPIYKSGVLVGVLGMDFPFETLVSQVSAVKVYQTGFAFLADENGQVLYHPNMVLGSKPDVVGDPGLFRQEGSGDELKRYTINGEARQMSFSTLRSGMKLVVTAPEREITASWAQMTRIILLATAAVILCFSLILLLALGILIRPLQRLTAASRRLADGDYDIELPPSGKDEVGLLTGAFGQMRDHIQGYISDLNRRIVTDDLTGLSNMNHFLQLAEEGLQEMRERGEHPALLYFNLIGLKYYNRQFSFAEGDRLLCAIADILARHYGAEHCARFGQDHFAVYTVEERLCERLQAVLDDCGEANGEKSLPVRAGVYLDRLEQVSVSIGCDRAKYACDQQRGSRLSGYHYFTEAMLKQNENYRYIINNLDRAIAEGWIRVYYQPIIRAANGKVCDEEALSRWVDPEKGFLSPGEFIPVLEEARLIYKLDLYVLDQILLKLQREQEAGLYLVPQSLNLSRVDFESCDIIGEICQRVDRAGIPRDKLTIEVTESAVGRDLEFIKEQVEKLQGLGFQVWMDDFGSGYSSLDVLQNIRFDLIKFDMRFMQRFSEGAETKIILTELMKMSVSLGIETVAEGVESIEQVDFLREVGCTKLQGFFYSRAIPLEEILDRNRKGTQIGYENPAEEHYYAALGRINLYDLATLSTDSGDGLANYFDTLPMAVVEYDGQRIRFVRSNKSYRDFMARVFHGIESSYTVAVTELQADNAAPFARAIAQCRAEGDRAFIDGAIGGGRSIHAIARFVARNPVTGIAACTVAVLGISNRQEEVGSTPNRVS